MAARHLPVNAERDGNRPVVETFSTVRLHAERLSLYHAEYLATLHRDPAVMAMIGGTRSAEESELWLRRNLEHWDDNGFGQWMLRDATSQLVGRAGLRWIDSSVCQHVVEVGYVLERSAWTAGLATEVTTGIIGIGATAISCPSWERSHS